MHFHLSSLSLLGAFFFSFSLQAKLEVIAHRGASGTLPEHTLPAYALAAGMGANYLEPDVVCSKDKVAFIRHEADLSDSTNVYKTFPDKNYDPIFNKAFVFLFTAQELKKISARERIDPMTWEAVFKDRYPAGIDFAPLVSLDEFLTFVKALNKNREKPIKIYPEIKEAELHSYADIDATKIVYKTLEKHGYEERPEEIFLQSFEFSELERLKNEFKTKIPLIYLTEVTNIPWKRVKKIAKGIGCPIEKIVKKEKGKWVATQFLKKIKKNKLLVHPYTLRADDLPKGFKSFEEVIHVLDKLEIDAVFTDFPGRARKVLDQMDL